MRLEDIGFYTLSDYRAKTACHDSRLSRCELVLTARCNFRCPYCRSVGGKDIPFDDAAAVVKLWAYDGLRNIRFSGGEPTLYPGLCDLCSLARNLGGERVAVSTNGSASLDYYKLLLDCGVDDFSVSLDACCAEDGDRMAGGVKGAFNKVIDNIQFLASKAYTTVGVVLTEANAHKVGDIILLAYGLGVHDIRLIPAAQNGDRFNEIEVDPKILGKYPILRHRIKGIQEKRPVRGLRLKDSHKCGLSLDDMAVNQGKHYPCIIYLRESGRAIGKVGQGMRNDRLEWYDNHDTHTDQICLKNCLDFCVDYNNKHEQFHIMAETPCNAGEVAL